MKHTLLFLLTLLPSIALADTSISPDNSFHAVIGTPIANLTPVPLATAISGTRRYITQWTVGNSAAAVGTTVDLYSGTNIIDSCPAAPAYGGCTKSYPVAPLRSGSGETISCVNRTTSASVVCSISGYLSTR